MRSRWTREGGYGRERRGRDEKGEKRWPTAIGCKQEGGPHVGERLVGRVESTQVRISGVEDRRRGAESQLA